MELNLRECEKLGFCEPLCGCRDEPDRRMVQGATGSLEPKDFGAIGIVAGCSVGLVAAAAYIAKKRKQSSDY